MQSIRCLYEVQTVESVARPRCRRIPSSRRPRSFPRDGWSEGLAVLTEYFGAEGATPDGIVKVTAEQRATQPGGRAFRGFGPPGGFGRGPGRGRGFGWWRPGGDFSRPLLANPTFYARFKKRLDELTETVFTKDLFGPRIDALRTQLGPEFRLRAKMRNADEAAAEEELDQIVQALHEHLDKRCTFVRSQLTAN